MNFPEWMRPKFGGGGGAYLVYGYGLVCTVITNQGSLFRDTVKIRPVLK